ncbi:hypothetical protein GCM10011339_22090 [Echinicola rosea]|uniref:Uncharacterized protein n=2 Tax=Echinicola rosea TaxID=1807691 RepID=A0ABQ1V0R1_9BACT|nr:hypothetical protein GCM10011339_22090 [Echinicola rosea]
MMPSQIVAHDKNGIFVTKIKLSNELRGREAFPILEFYNNQMELRSFRQLQVVNSNSPAKFERILQIGGKLYCFYSIHEDDRNVLLADEIDKSTLTLSQTPTVLQRIPEEAKAKFERPAFHIKLSEGGNFLLSTFTQPGTKNTPDQLHFAVLDDKLSPRWSRQLEASQETGHYHILNYHISQTGDVFILKKVGDSEKALERFWQPNYQFSITAITHDGTTTAEVFPKVAGRHLTKMQIGTNAKSQLVCTGFFTTTGEQTTAGSYFLTFAGPKMIQKSFQPFAPILLAENDKANKEEKQEGLYAYRLNDITFRGDGSAILIAEQATQTAGFNPRTNYRTAKTAFNTIAVVSIAPDGEVMWTEQIRKNQVSPEGYSFFSSYATAVLNDKVYLVFNDHPENLCEGVCEPVHFNPKATQKDVLIAMVEVDWHGNVKKAALPFSRDLHILTKPLACKQVSNHQMVVLGQYNKAYRMARLDFDKTFSYQ